MRLIEFMRDEKIYNTENVQKLPGNQNHPIKTGVRMLPGMLLREGPGHERDLGRSIKDPDLVKLF